MRAALRIGFLKPTIISPCAQRDHNKKQRITKVAHSASVILVYKKKYTGNEYYFLSADSSGTFRQAVTANVTRQKSITMMKNCL